jgi:hypothetical protein
MLHVSGEIDHAGGVDHAPDARGFVVETGKVGFERMVAKLRR